MRLKKNSAIKNRTVAVVITTCNRHDDLLACVKSIVLSSYKKIEMIIIDDNSSDETKELTAAKIKKLTKAGFSVTIIHNKKNLKMVKARNLGARHARGEYVLFVDDDNILDSEMIGLLVKFADGHPDYGIIGPSMYMSDKKIYMNYQTIDFFTGWTRGIIEPKGPEYHDTDGVPNVFLIKAEVFKKSGYFDEALIQTFTEPDFAFNALRNGYKSCMLKDAKTYHMVTFGEVLTPRVLGGKFMQKAYCLMRNRSLIIKRYGNFLQKAVYTLFFSWVWPLVYSLIMLKFFRFDLMRFYWLGFWDGMGYMFTGRLNNSLEEILK